MSGKLWDRFVGRERGRYFAKKTLIISRETMLCKVPCLSFTQIISESLTATCLHIVSKFEIVDSKTIWICGRLSKPYNLIRGYFQPYLLLELIIYK